MQEKLFVIVILLLILPSQQVANVSLILTAALIGGLCYILGEGKHRRAFVEAKQSLEVKTLIEEQSAEQVRRKDNFSFSTRV